VRHLRLPTLVLKSNSIAPLQANSLLRISFAGVRNPTFSNMTKRFELRTTTSEGWTIDMLRADLRTNITVNRITGAQTTLLDPRGGAFTEISFSFKTFNDIPPYGKVCIDMPPSLTFYSSGSRFGFAGGARAYSAELGLGLVVTRFGGGPLSSDDHQACVVRSAGGGVCRAGRINVRITNVLTPTIPGILGPFGIATRLGTHEPIDVLDSMLSLNIFSGRYAPAPPPNMFSALTGAAPRRAQAPGMPLMLLVLALPAGLLLARMPRQAA